MFQINKVSVGSTSGLTVPLNKSTRHVESRSSNGKTTLILQDVIEQSHTSAPEFWLTSFTVSTTITYSLFLMKYSNLLLHL